MHRKLEQSEHVCKYQYRPDNSARAFLLGRMIDVIEEVGFPPCLVFERGDITLEEWTKKEREPFDQKAALLQV